MKTSIATGLVLAAIVAGLYFLYTSDMVSKYLNKSTEGITEITNIKAVEAPKEFGQLTEYFRTNLTAEEKESLKKVLAGRDQKLQGAYDALEKEYNREGGEMEKAFKKAEKIRQEIKETLIPFLDKNKRSEFEEKYRQLGRDLESEYIAK